MQKKKILNNVIPKSNKNNLIRYMRKILLTISMALFAITMMAVPKITGQTVENMKEPLGLSVSTPHFSWKILDASANCEQQRYRILVASSAGLLSENKGDLWDSGMVSSAEQLWIPYGGKPLAD